MLAIGFVDILRILPSSLQTKKKSFFCAAVYGFFFAVRPLSVEILFNNQPLSSDRNYQIECEAVGSRPPAKITWWMGGIELTGHTQKVRAYYVFIYDTNNKQATH